MVGQCARECGKMHKPEYARTVREVEPAHEI
jgi:hypothetical protein